MKKQSVVYGILGVSLAVFAIAAVSKIVTSAKSSPEAIADTPVTPKNIAEQKAALEAVDQADLKDGMTHEGETLYHDADNNLYRYDENGKLIGLTKLADQDDASLPKLSEAELRDYAEQYLAGLVEDPARYTLEEFSSDNGIYTAHWTARCCGYKTTDIVSIMMRPTGTLQSYTARHTGDFADVKVSDAQIAEAIAQAEAKAATEDTVIKKVAGTDEVVLTHDENGNLLLNVGISREVRSDEMPLTVADIVQVPIV